MVGYLTPSHPSTQLFTRVTQLTSLGYQPNRLLIMQLKWAHTQRRDERRECAHGGTWMMRPGGSRCQSTLAYLTCHNNPRDAPS